MQKVTIRLCRYPVGQKFRQNCSISLRFQDKHIFVLNAEIQDGHQKWRENDFYKKSPVDSTDTLWVKNFIEITLSRSVIKINVVFFSLSEKLPVDSASLHYRDKCVFVFSALRKIVTFSKSLISWPFCIGSLPKVNDFQTSI